MFYLLKINKTKPKFILGLVAKVRFQELVNLSEFINLNALGNPRLKSTLNYVIYNENIRTTSIASK